MHLLMSVCPFLGCFFNVYFDKGMMDVIERRERVGLLVYSANKGEGASHRLIYSQNPTDTSRSESTAH